MAIHFNFVNCSVRIYPTGDNGDGDGIVVAATLDDDEIIVSKNHPAEED